jgi:16S rRNA processing protein RimM
MIELTLIGKILKTTGIQGYLKIFVEEDYLDYLENPRFVFIDINGSKVPFRVEELKFDAQIQLKLSKVETESEAKFLSQCQLFIESKYIPETIESFQDLYFEHLIGYKLIDQNSAWSGVINNISLLPEQEIAHVSNAETEVLIPLHEDLIIQIDDIEKTILMNLPEGLIQLNK